MTLNIPISALYIQALPKVMPRVPLSNLTLVYSLTSLLMTKAELVPPNPNELLSIVFSSVSTVRLARFNGAEYSSGSSKLMFGATKLFCIIMSE